jgi:Cu/Ag efflux protein CusF
MIRLPKVRMALAFVALLGLAFTASADEDKGTVKSVFLDKNEIVLKGILSDTTYDINKDAKVCLDGRKAKLADLKEGDKVAIDFEKTGDRRKSGEVRALRKATEATGAVRGVNAEKNMLIHRGVLKDANKHHEKDASVWINGKAGELADLREGDQVAVVYEERENMNHATEIRLTRKK